MKKVLATLSLLLALALCLTACGGGSKDSGASAPADLQAVLSEFKLGEEMMSLSLSDLNDVYFLGLDEADVKQCVGAVHTSGINCDEIILIEATNADAAGRVKAALETHFQAQKDAMENYIPEEFAIMQQCSVTQKGNYVSMIVSPNAKEYTEIYNKAIG